MNAPNIGLRRRMTLDNEHYYIIVTNGPDGLVVDVTAPRENAPENAHMRQILENICTNINSMIAEVQHGRGNAALD